MCRESESPEMEPDQDNIVVPVEMEKTKIVEPFEMEKIPKFLLQLSKDDPQDVLAALTCLYTIFSLTPTTDKEMAAAASAAIRKEAIGLGMVGVLVITMRKWKNAPTIQASAMSCLGFLAVDEALSIAKLGGVDLIVSALEDHPDRLDVQEAGVYALAKLLIPKVGTRVGGVFLSNCVKRFVEQLDGLVIVVKATDKFPDSTRLHAGACTLFGKIASHSKYHEALQESGAISVATKAAEGDSGEESLKENGRLFLSKMPKCVVSECWA